MVRCSRYNVKEAFSDFIERREYTLASVPGVIFNPLCYKISKNSVFYAGSGFLM